ncbi:MAG: GTP pyrophosphokinase [Chloroflexota bacterium]
MPTIEDAIFLALEAHRGVKQKDGSPYILHPLALMTRFHTEAEQMVAVLHDVIEDTDVALDDLRAAGYPENVLQALELVTRRSDETYDEFIERIKPHPLARRVKIADLEHNMDVRRLPEVTEKDRERMERYRRTWFTLQAAEKRGD